MTVENGGDPAPALQTGDVVAHRYELLEFLGRGGMGEVWKARHTLLQGYRALKVIAPDLSRDPRFRDRFLLEGQTMMRVRHPAVVQVTDLDELPGSGQLFMVMEFLDGEPLQSAAREPDGVLCGDQRTTVRVLREVAQGVQRIHDEQIIHKDLKSENILLVTEARGALRPKVIDFGIAKDVGEAEDFRAGRAADGGRGMQQTTLSGTPAYLAPELFKGKPSSRQSDVYSFGVVAYECLSGGKFPHEADSITEIIRVHREDKPAESLAVANPDVDPYLIRLVDRCLSVSPEDRPQSFQEIAQALQRWLKAPERRRRVRRALLIASALFVLAAAAVWGFFFTELTASLGAVEVSSGGRPVPVHEGMDYITLASASALEVSARYEGRASAPRLMVDGRRHVTKFEREDGRLVTTVDLSDLAEGRHALSLQAATDAAPSTRGFVLDFTPPVIASVGIAGSEDLLTTAESPVIEVHVEEAPGSLRQVSAHRDGRTFPASRPGTPEGPWTIAGTMNRDGTVSLTVRAVDRAGNVSERTLECTRDTVAPSVTIEDHFLTETGAAVVQVRRAEGSAVRLTVDEPATLAFTTPDGRTEVEAPTAGPVSLPLPSVSADGLAVSLEVRDRAGNPVTREFHVLVVEDTASVTLAGGEAAGAVKPDRPVRIVLARSYPLGRAGGLSARLVLDAAGLPVEGEARDLTLPVLASLDGDRRRELTLPAGTLPAGVWRLEPTGFPVSEPSALRLTVDGDRPEVRNIRIRGLDGVAVAPGEWVRSREMTVEVEVADLSLASVELGPMEAVEPPRPGRGVYTFRPPCEEGETLWTLVLVDAAGNSTEESVVIRADWTVPALGLHGPDPAETFDDVVLTPFDVECSDVPYSLRIRRHPGGELLDERLIESKRFRHEIQLPAGDPLRLLVSAVDRAGNESAPLRLDLRVQHRRAGLTDRIRWERGVTVSMRRVAEGDVAFGGRVYSVPRMFVDRTEVTNGQYREFLAATKDGHGPWCHPDETRGWDHRPGSTPGWADDTLPVVNVAWWDAHAFAGWSGRRLPTEAEWVKAAVKPTDRAEVEMRSWPPFPGRRWEDDVLATLELTERKGPVPAGETLDVSPAGCLHMGGNVSEWVAAGRNGATGVRGGNWFYPRSAANVRDVPLKVYSRSFRAETIGFRCAVDEEEVKK